MQRKLTIRLAELLKERGITQAQLADAIGVRRATINDMYHNRSKHIPRDVVDKIIAELVIDDVNELMGVDEVK